jgi:hypothetical protein
MPTLRSLALLAILTAPAVIAQTNPLEVHIALSKTTALLGEPVWIEVTATNRTQQPLAVSWGTACAIFPTTPIEIDIPNATQGNGQPAPCAGGPLDCMIPGPTTLAPGESDTRRYVLKGDFRITRPGRYQVIVHKSFGWSPAPPKHEVALPQNHSLQSADLETTLEVTPPDPARLLQIEQSLAAEAAIPYTRAPLTYPPGLTQEAYMLFVRAWSEADRKARTSASQHSQEIFDGLAEYPAAGMEPIFLTSKIGNGIAALQRLNTPEARKALARLAEPIPERIVNGVRQSDSRWVAVRALAATGDLTYIPIIESYLTDPDPEVRRAAIFGIGELAGDQALPTLNRIARETTSQVERSDAISTIGSTKSANAVPILINLFNIPNPGDPTAPNFALMRLTHHTPSLATTDPTQMKSQWAAWWQANSKTAQIFGPYDCTRTYDR